jgi:hypothetical protein
MYTAVSWAPRSDYSVLWSNLCWQLRSWSLNATWLNFDCTALKIDLWRLTFSPRLLSKYSDKGCSRNPIVKLPLAEMYSFLRCVYLSYYKISFYQISSPESSWFDKKIKKWFYFFVAKLIIRLNILIILSNLDIVCSYQ